MTTLMTWFAVLRYARRADVLRVGVRAAVAAALVEACRENAELRGVR